MNAEGRSSADQRKRTSSLQWGRVLMNAERAAAWLAADRRMSIASMGPRSYERGKGTLAMTIAAICAASMGPRSYERGKWSSLACHRSQLLQWGRVLMNAERRDGMRACAVGNTASMGPRSYERGKDELSMLRDHVHSIPLQWGRVLMNAERLLAQLPQFQHSNVEIARTFYLSAREHPSARRIELYSAGYQCASGYSVRLRHLAARDHFRCQRPSVHSCSHDVARLIKSRITQA